MRYYGRPVSTTNPAGKAVINRYDALGHVVDTISSAGDKVYNINDQIVEKWIYPADSSRGYLLSSAAYDTAGRLLWEAGEDGKKTRYTYKADDQIVTKTTPTGHIVSWQYNITGLPLHEWLNGKTISQINYDHITIYWRTDDSCSCGCICCDFIRRCAGYRICQTFLFSIQPGHNHQ